jgi:hypothetical protein
MEKVHTSTQPQAIKEFWCMEITRTSTTPPGSVWDLMVQWFQIILKRHTFRLSRVIHELDSKATRRNT